jgi:hypothetical protein
MLIGTLFERKLVKTPEEYFENLDTGESIMIIY